MPGRPSLFDEVRFSRMTLGRLRLSAPPGARDTRPPPLSFNYASLRCCKKIFDASRAPEEAFLAATSMRATMIAGSRPTHRPIDAADERHRSLIRRRHIAGRKASPRSAASENKSAMGSESIKMFRCLFITAYASAALAHFLDARRRH